MRDILKLTVVLFLISAIAGLAIAFTSKQTAPAIKLQTAKADTEALAAVLPQYDTLIELAGTGDLPPRYWQALKDGATVAWAFEVASRGYSSLIKFVVSVSPEGEILGLTVKEQGETPGLGTRVQEVASKLTFWNGLFKKEEKQQPWFCSQFAGLDITKQIGIDKSKGEWGTMDETSRAALQDANAVSAITGSTISTKAVVSGVMNQAGTWFKAVNGDAVEAVSAASKKYHEEAAAQLATQEGAE